MLNQNTTKKYKSNLPLLKIIKIEFLWKIFVRNKKDSGWSPWKVKSLYVNYAFSPTASVNSSTGVSISSEISSTSLEISSVSLETSSTTSSLLLSSDSV